MKKSTQHPNQTFWLLLIFLLFGTTAVSQNQPAAEQFIRKSSQKLAFDVADTEELDLRDTYFSDKTGYHYLYFQQQYKGIDVWNGIFNIVMKEEQVVHSTHSFQKKLPEKANIEQPLVTPLSAIHSTTQNLGLPPGIYNLLDQQQRNGKTVKAIYSEGGVSSRNIEVELIWFPMASGEVRLAWNVNLKPRNRTDWWNVRIDASNGAFLEKNNWTLHCKFGHSECNQSHHHSNTIKKETTNSEKTGAAWFDYKVIAMPLENINQGPRTIVNSPWTDPDICEANAVTLGWHNDGSSTYNTVTRGNNTDTYEDTDATNTPTGGNAARAQDASGEFDFPLDPGAMGSTYLDAAITNLFYWTNIVHDVFYHYGFDEPAGNFQQNNMGRGGLGGDLVLAEAQDGSGTDNANFSAPPDGFPGQMQMYLWSAVAQTNFLVNSPTGIAGGYGALESNFSINNKLANLGPVTGDLVLAIDNSGGTSEACTLNPISNAAAINGNIAVIDRGTCPFTEKVKNAQNAGAIAVLVCNNVPGFPVYMSGDDNTITIPAIMINQTDCNLIKANLTGVNVTMDGYFAMTDSDLDNGIIVHEYGHGISMRLTGGPSAASCLYNAEQMGEGWSDYFGLMLTTDWNTASATDIRGIGTYVIGEILYGGGIRPYPYTTDMGINPTTYADLSNLGFTEPHGVGFLWGTMLWDMTWAIIAQEGVDPNIYCGTGGNNIALQLVVEALKLQPCSPGFVDGRDAILAADELLYNGEYSCIIWDAFANRGVGYSADQGLSSDRTDQVAAFDLPATEPMQVIKTADKTIVEEGDVITYSIIAKNKNCSNINNVVVSDVLPTELTYVSGSASHGGTYDSGTRTLSFPSVASLGINTSTVTYTFQATANIGTYSAPTYPVDDDVEGGALWTANPSSGADRWVMTNFFPNSPSTSWAMPNSSTKVFTTMTLTNPVSLTGCPTLEFMHFYNLESTWDGGVVEISTDAGASWIDMEPYFTSNGYNSAIAGNSNNDIAGRAAYTGFSNSYVQTTADLSAFSGETVTLRFAFGSDDNTTATGPVVGWFIDDIKISNISGIANTGYSTYNSIQGEDAVCTQLSVITPVELLEIKATPLSRSIDVEWTTISETENTGFELYRSSEGEEFEPIAWIPTQGNGTELQTYHYEDRGVASNTRYFYKFKQIDYDRTFSWSPVASAMIINEGKVDIYPNPTADFFILEALEPLGNTRIQIINMKGELVETFNLNIEQSNKFEFDLKDLPGGMYFININPSVGRNFTKKLVLQKL